MKLKLKSKGNKEDELTTEMKGRDKGGCWRPPEDHWKRKWWKEIRNVFKVLVEC